MDATIRSIQEIRQVLALYGSTERTRRSGEGAPEPAVSLSPEAADFLYLRRAAQEAPDRTEMVEKLRRQVATGRYNPDLDTVAEKMLSGHVLDRTV